MSFGARAHIRLDALQHNLSVIKSKAPASKVMAVIKANAYGHGLLEIASALPNVDALAVARVSEALQLRGVGITRPIVLLAGVVDQSELNTAIDGDFQVVVHGDEQLQILATASGGPIDVWLKIDTGMHRLGFEVDRTTDLIERLNAMPVVRQVRLMTHLASADERDNATTSTQLQRFITAAESFDGDVSIANTPATLAWPATTEFTCGEGANWVRPGIALFGISPFADRLASDMDLQPVMQFEARLIATKALRKGAEVGYKGIYAAPADTRLGILSAGYGDGYSRHFRSGTPILINGRRVPLIGHVSMDMIAVDLGPTAADSVGDIATLWGDGLPVEEVAPWADAIPYELVCGIMNRETSTFSR